MDHRSMREWEAYGFNGEKKNQRQRLFVALFDWMKQSLQKKKRISEEKKGTSRRPKNKRKEEEGTAKKKRKKKQSDSEHNKLRT